MLLATIPRAAAVGLPSIAQLVVVSLLKGFARVFFDVDYQSYIPAVIGKERMLAGNASGRRFGPQGSLWVPASAAGWSPS